MTLGNDEMMLRVFVCSPYRGDVKVNVARAQDMCRLVARSGHAPYAPHLYLPGFLDDNIEQERAIGIATGIEFLEVCDVLLLPHDVEPTAGMRAEIARAEDLGMPILRMKPDGGVPGELLDQPEDCDDCTCED